jgi:hypothetical protein
MSLLRNHGRNPNVIGAAGCIWRPLSFYIHFADVGADEDVLVDQTSADVAGGFGHDPEPTCSLHWALSPFGQGPRSPAHGLAAAPYIVTVRTKLALEALLERVA